MPLATSDVRPTIAVAVQQLLQQEATHLVHGGADGHFTGFQVQVSKSLAVLEHTLNDAI